MAWLERDWPFDAIEYAPRTCPPDAQVSTADRRSRRRTVSPGAALVPLEMARSSPGPLAHHIADPPTAPRCHQGVSGVASPDRRQWWAAANWSASVEPASAVVQASRLIAEVTRSKEP